MEEHAGAQGGARSCNSATQPRQRPVMMMADFRHSEASGAVVWHELLGLPSRPLPRPLHSRLADPHGRTVSARDDDTMRYAMSRARATLSIVLLSLWLRAAVDLDDLHGEDQAPGDTAVVAIGKVGGNVRNSGCAAEVRKKDF